MKGGLLNILKDEWRFLTFRPIKIEPSMQHQYLAFGLLFTWLCGIGRYWDNPKAELWQYLGLGSLAYVFILALVLWLIIMPLKPRHWSYQSVLLFVTLTSPPAILYAIPVEQFLSLKTAQNINVWFLLIVAVWRVALLIRHLSVVAGLNGISIMVASFLPMTLIVTALTALNLEHVVFRVMAGLADHEKTANDAAYTVLWLITFFSVIFSAVLAPVYLWLIYKNSNKTQ